jgi:signal transduction histidine kinase
MHKIIYIVLLLLAFNGASFSQKNVLNRLKSIDKITADTNAIKALEIILNENLTVNQQLEVNLRLLVRLYHSQQFGKAVLIGNTGLALAQKQHLDSMEGAFNKQLGNAYYYMELRKKAKEYFKTAYDIAHEKKLWELEASCSHNYGAVLTDFREFKEGEYYLKNSIKILEQHTKNIQSECLTYRVLGALYLQTNQLNKAEQIFKGLIDKLHELKDTNLICSNLLYYSTLIKQRGDTLRALEMSQKAINLIQKQNNFHSLIATKRTHGLNLADAKKYKEAYQMDSAAFNLLKKSYNNDVEKQISETEVKFKTAQIKQEKENADLRSKKKQQIILISFFSGFIILVSGFVFFNQRKNNKQKIAIQQQRLESLIEGEEKERSRIAKDLHDGIVQDLTAIKLKIQGIKQGDIFFKEISDDIDQAAKEVRDIAYQMMPIALREYGLIPSLENLLQKTLSNNNIKYDFETVNIEERLSEKIEVCLYRITQELLNNVIKHSKANFVSLVISKHQDFISLIFEDNGTGFNETEVKKGIGMTSLSSRLEIVNGELKFESSEGSGTMAIIKIPINFQ